MSIFIIDTLKQKNNGEFPLIDSNDIQGGFYQVGSIAERDSIPSVRRKEGMLCWVKSEKVIYQLENGIGNQNWVVFKVEGTTSGGGGNTDLDGYSHIWIGTAPPQDLNMIWIDTRTDGILDDEDDMDTINDLKSLISNMQMEIDALKRRIKYLEDNGVTTNPNPTETDSVLLEDGTSILLEDGTPLLLE